MLIIRLELITAVIPVSNNVSKKKKKKVIKIKIQVVLINLPVLRRFKFVNAVFSKFRIEPLHIPIRYIYTRPDFIP